MGNGKTQKYSFRAEPFLVDGLKRKYLTDNISKAITMAMQDILAPTTAENLEIKPLFPILGSKSKTMVQRILKIMPEHTTYVEPFAGAGAVLIAKPESNVEIYNDLNGRLCNLLRIVKSQPLEFYLKCNELFISESLLMEQKHITEFDSALDDAVNYFYLMAISIYGDCKSLKHGFGTNMFKSYKKRLDLVDILSKRLENVTMFNRDFSYIIRKYDSPNTLFYCDPPYFGKEGYYSEKFTREQHQQLSEILKGIKGKFILSYYAKTQIYRLYRSRRIYHISYRTRRNSGYSKMVTEKLICNFEFGGSKPLL